jgi:Na+/H+ antiporter NhaD/arsenite permease-like protein
LLPIGDPPLFLGYLKGVEFLWTMWHLWFPWLVTNAILIAMYYCIDRFIYYPRETQKDLRLDKSQTRALRVSGLWPNAALLGGVILCVALLDPSKALPGTDWHAPPHLREIVQLILVALSLMLGTEKIRTANKFNYHAIIEVAALFIGIFICMQPAIEILHVRGSELGLDTPMKLFWTTGSLSAVLDNAPTYVVFYETAAADPRFADTPFHQLVSSYTAPHADEARRQLEAISLGAVFMGAMTYIGNGPNFMVRAIAEQSDIRMPSFFGYLIRYTIPMAVPVFLLVTFLLIA